MAQDVWSPELQKFETVAGIRMVLGYLKSKNHMECVMAVLLASNTEIDFQGIKHEDPKNN